MLTLNVYTRTPPAQADHCLELKSVESEKDLWRETQLIAMLSPWSSVWRKTLFNLCKESRLWTDFSQEEERGGTKGSKRCEGLHCKRVIYLHKCFLNFLKILSVFYANIFHGTKITLAFHLSSREFGGTTESIKITWVNALEQSFNRITDFPLIFGWNGHWKDSLMKRFFCKK